MTQPLYGIKADFFKTLGHPARIRALELLSTGERSVTELQKIMHLESSHLSQQLAVLRKAGLVKTRKQGTTVYYSITAPEVAQILAMARHILTGVLSDQIAILDELKSAAAGTDYAGDLLAQPEPLLAGPSGAHRRRANSGTKQL